MKKPSFIQPLQSENGMAIIETVPLLVVFVVLMSFGMGFFGIVHTSVLHSIAARTYAFETFRNRANLYYFREDGSGLESGKSMHYGKKGWRYHAVQHESDDRQRFVATTRPIALGSEISPQSPSETVHNKQVYEMLTRNDRISVNPAWIMVGYGICLNARCGN